jgi:hypothetical protein
MASRRLFDGAAAELGLLPVVGASALASGAYWIAHLDSAWPGTPTGAQIAAGKLSNNNAAAYAGSEPAPTSGSGTITEATAITGLMDSTSYRIAWVVYDSVSNTYSNVVVGNVTTDAAGGLLQDTHDGFWRKQWKKIREREKKKIHAELIEEIEEIEEQIEEVKAVQVVATKAIAKAQYMPDYSEQARIIAALIARRQELIEQEDEELLLLL